MATVKFDRILQEFSSRIGDRLASAFTPGTMVFPEGKIITAAMSISYINRALHKYFNDAMFAVQGDQKKILELIPEIISSLKTVTFTAGVYQVADPNLDYYDFVGGLAGSAQLRRESATLLDLFLAGNYPLHPPSTTRPVVISVKDKLYIFPNTITSAQILYLRQPLDNTTGAFLTQNGNVDSPFYDARNNAIAMIAEALYWDEKHPGKG